LRRATAGGLVLIGTTVLTLIAANSPLGESLAQFWEQPVSIGMGAWTLKQTLHHWINDGLMALFFLLVGLELKRELLVGELASLRDAALPIVAAIGGMVVPAGIYLALNPVPGGPWLGHPHGDRCCICDWHTRLACLASAARPGRLFDGAGNRRRPWCATGDRNLLHG
jgi:hypothetical protein